MRISDWSSDVCSSDLVGERKPARRGRRPGAGNARRWVVALSPPSRCGREWGSKSVAELLVTRGVHQPVELSLVGQRHAKEPALAFGEIGRASCRERVCLYV